MSLPDQVFCMLGAGGTPIWKAVVGGAVLAADWPDRGSALAGLEVEQRRAARHHTFEAVWQRMSDNERGIVRMGMIPAAIAAEMERVHQLGAREIAVGFFRCARKDGGMRA